MKGKKLLASVLSAAMVLGTMVLPAFADDEATELPAADENGVITLTEDVTLKGSFNISDNLDLGGHSLTIDNVTSVIKNGTIKNGTIKVAQNANSPETMLRIGDYSHASLEVEMKDVTIDATEDYTASCGLLGIYQESKLTLNNVTINVGSNDGVAVIYGNDQKADLIANNINITAVNQNKLIYGVKDADIKNMKFEGKINKELFSVVGGKVKDSTFTYTNAENETSRSIVSDAGLEKELTFINTKIENAPTFTNGAMNNTGSNSKVVADDLSTVNGDKMVDIADAKLAVAQIDSNVYTTLTEAVAAAQDGGTVTLVNDVTESIEIAKGQEITLDLNGKTLTNTEAANTITNNGTLKIVDLSEDKTGKVENANTSKAILFNAGGATAILNGGTFERTEPKTYYAIKNLGTMTINEGVTVNQFNESSSAVANGCANSGEYTGSDVKLTINGGTFVQGLITIKNDEWGVLEINGGNFKNINGNYTVFNWNKAVITGGTFEANYVVGNGKYNEHAVGDVDITGGTFDGIICPDQPAIGYTPYPSDDISISGGTFSTDVSKYCAAGCKARFVNSKYVVGKDESTDTITLTFEKHSDDERVYDIVLSGNDGDINRLNAAEFKFNMSNTNMTYEIKAADKLTTLQPDADKYVFYFDGKDAINNADSGAKIIIGTVTFDGYGKFTFGVKNGENIVNKVTATTTADNLVTEFVVGGATGKGTLVIDKAESIINGNITVPTQNLTINVLMNHPVQANVAEYQDMTVAISGGDLAGKVLTYKLGNKDTDIDETTKTVAQAADGSYEIKTSLTQNRPYTVTVSGAGYRTARYTVTMTKDKTMNVWNNVMSNEITVVDDTKAKKNFLAGDIIKDGKINIYDLSAVVAYFGEKMDTATYNKYAKYDLNRDGKIDMMDISIVLTSWGE